MLVRNMAKNILSNIILEFLANAIRHETKTIFQKEDNILISVGDRIAYFYMEKETIKTKV